jgi:cardiolipin synthase
MFPDEGLKPMVLLLRALITLSLALSVGCSDLPNVRNLLERSGRSVPPTIITAAGKLSSHESRAVLARLEQEAGSTDILDQHLAREELVTGSPLIAGNRIKLLPDGPSAYAAMTTAIQGAKDHVNLETYIFEDDLVGQRFAELLIAKQQQGVQVNIIYDGMGGLSTASEFFDRLRQHGIMILEYNPLTPFDLKRLSQRNHRKILVVDGKTAFVGGVNISRVYSKSPFAKSATRKDANSHDNWRDSHIQIEGPSVAAFQQFFLDDWNTGNGSRLAPKNYFPPAKEKGKLLVRPISSSPRNHSYAAYEMFVSALTHAQRYIHLTQAYFVPDQAILEALKSAARRGVQVTIILPSFGDSGPVFHAGRSHYSDLLRTGVRVYERQQAFLHAKTAVIDGVWSTVGSANLDWRSFIHNDEVNAVILGRDFADQLNAVFQQDLKASRKVTMEEWDKRPLVFRVEEWVSRLFEYWL